MDRFRIELFLIHRFPSHSHMKRQLAYILARQQVTIETEDEVLSEILNNTKLSENFKRFGKELNVTDPKSLEDIYKSHLENTRESYFFSARPSPR